MLSSSAEKCTKLKVGSASRLFIEERILRTAFSIHPVYIGTLFSRGSTFGGFQRGKAEHSFRLQVNVNCSRGEVSISVFVTLYSNTHALHKQGMWAQLITFTHKASV